MILINLIVFIFQSIPVKDVKLPDNIPDLELTKHINYIVSYGTNKDDYVSLQINISIIRQFWDNQKMYLTYRLIV